MSDLLDRVGVLAAEDPAVRSVLQVLVGDRPADPAIIGAVARAVNEERRRVTVDDFMAASLRTSEVVLRLPGVTTRQAISKMRQAKQLLGRQVGRQTYFPAWQFGPTGLRDHLPRVLSALNAYIGDDAVAADRVMRLERDELGGSTLDAGLRSRRHQAEAWRVLEALGGLR